MVTDCIGSRNSEEFMSIDLKKESMGPTPFREKSEPRKRGLTCLHGRKPYMFTHFLVLLLVLNPFFPLL